MDFLEEELAAKARAAGSRAADKRVRVLDLGCGVGDITTNLLAHPRLTVVGLDISAEALSQFQRRSACGASECPALVRGDVYRLPFADRSFGAVVSFGYASAGSYQGVDLEVARVLVQGGVALIDFANPSLYHWLRSPRSTFRWYRRFRSSASSQYHFGVLGIADHFSVAGLACEETRYFNAYPPLRFMARLPWIAAIDRQLSRAFGRLLGRVLIVKLRRTRTTTDYREATAITPRQAPVRRPGATRGSSG